MFLAVVLLLGAAVALFGGDDLSAPPTAAPARGAGAASAEPPGSSPSGRGQPCRRPPAQAALATPPDDVHWAVFKSVALPYSAGAGPGVVDGEVARCFAHSPHGALIASWQITVRCLLADSWQRVTASQVLAGPGRSAYTSARAQISGNASQPGVFAQLASYQYVHYTPELAVLQLVTRSAQGALNVSTVTMRWVDGDWRLTLQEDGSLSPTTQIGSLESFIAWGGV
ncbi:hypothetical protein ACFQX6_67355 [Streptosporangium lutulentum]